MLKQLTQEQFAWLQQQFINTTMCDMITDYWQVEGEDIIGIEQGDGSWKLEKAGV